MSHFYSINGEACHFVAKKDGSGNRPSTVADARKNGWVPSPTTILKILHREQLVEWLIRNACTAVLTAPRKSDEDLDSFVNRVLNVECQQDQESQIARDLGTDIHAAIELALNGQQFDYALTPICPRCIRNYALNDAMDRKRDEQIERELEGKR